MIIIIIDAKFVFMCIVLYTYLTIYIYLDFLLFLTKFKKKINVTAVVWS